MAGPGRLLHGAVKDGMLECLRGTLAFGAGDGAVVIPGGVGAEVTLPRSHLVKAACGQLVQAHKPVGLERGAVRVLGWVWRDLVPFLYEEVLAFELELGVGATRWGHRVGLAEQVLRADRQGGVAIGALEEKHGVREGVQGQMCPVFEGRLGWHHGRGRRLPAFLADRTLWSGEWRGRDRVCTEAGSLATAGLLSGGEHKILSCARRRL